jgi:hypothetical protein
MSFHYENGNRVIRFDLDPSRHAGKAKAEQWDHDAKVWKPASSGLAFEVMGFQPDWDFLGEDEVADFIRKLDERFASNRAKRNGYCEFCGDVRPWPSDVSRFCSDECKAERDDLQRERDAERAAAASDEDRDR